MVANGMGFFCEKIDDRLLNKLLVSFFYPSNDELALPGS
jgi:hypothetical protein